MKSHSVLHFKCRLAPIPRKLLALVVMPHVLPVATGAGRQSACLQQLLPSLTIG